MTEKRDTRKPLAITWLCQGGFLLESDSLRIVFDPYLSDSLSRRGLDRIVPIPISIEGLKPDIVCFTHDHADHFDEETVVPIYQLYPECRFVGPKSTWLHFEKLELETNRFDLLSAGGTIEIRGLEIKAIHAYHTDPDSVGMIIRIGNKVIYLSGDTEYNDKLVSDIVDTAGDSIDAALICINGKLGNMNTQQALQVVNAIRPGITIPMHYGLFAENTVNPLPFAKAVRSKGLECLILTPGKSYDLFSHNEYQQRS